MPSTGCAKFGDHTCYPELSKFKIFRSPFFKGKLFDVPGTITYVNAADYPLRASRILRMHVVKELEKFSKTVASGDTSTGKEVVISKKQGNSILFAFNLLINSGYN